MGVPIFILVLVALASAPCRADAVDDGAAQLSAPELETVRRGIAALGASGEPRAVGLLAARIDAGLPPAALMEAVGAIVRIGGRPAHAVLYALCRHRVAAVRAAALRGLVTTRAPRAAPVVVGMLDDPSAAVRAAAVEALDALGPGGAIDELLVLARHGQPEAAALLGRRADAGAVRRIGAGLEAGDADALAAAIPVWMAREDLRPPVRVRLAEQLIGLGPAGRAAVARAIAALPEADPVRARIDAIPSEEGGEGEASPAAGAER